MSIILHSPFLLHFVEHVGIILKRSGFAYAYYIFKQCYIMEQQNALY